MNIACEWCVELEYTCENCSPNYNHAMGLYITHDFECDLLEDIILKVVFQKGFAYFWTPKNGNLKNPFSQEAVEAITNFNYDVGRKMSNVLTICGKSFIMTGLTKE